MGARTRGAATGRAPLMSVSFHVYRLLSVPARRLRRARRADILQKESRGVSRMWKVF